MLKLFNTLTRKKEEFKPIAPPEVRLYTCGPTVYNFAHIGNLRSYIFSDILCRVLRYNNYQVKQVMNITDVGHLTSDADAGEDKIVKAAQKEKKTPWQIAEFYTKTFKKDMQLLNITEPDIWCRATEHIQEMIEFCQRLEKNGFTYFAGGNLYFNTAKFKNYGELAKLKLDELKEGARVEKDPNKKNPTDFVLWFTKSKFQEQEMKWDSPWGTGYPGWHIECSAMSTKYLGEHFDIHTGGVDHISVHHTNERAQNFGALGQEVVERWLHGEFLIMGKGKMAKSAGGFITLQTLIEKGFNPLAYRYLCLTTHYRTPLTFSWEALEAAQNALNNLYGAVREYGAPKIGCAEYEENFLKAINDDLNMPKALGLVWDLIKSDYPSSAKKATLLRFDKVLGLDLGGVKKIIIPAEVKKLVQEREQARKEKNWLKADELRQQVEKAGFYIEDTSGGPKIYPKLKLT